MIRVLVSAESAIARAGIETVLRSSPNIEVAGSGLAVWEAAAEIERLSPDVIVAEAGDAAPELSSMPAAAVVLLSRDPEPEWIREVLRAGVRAVLPAQASADEIIAAVEAAAAGLVVLDPRDLETLIGASVRASRALPAAEIQPLTSREIEVLRMIAEGLGNKTIAWKLGISEHTVKFHAGSIMHKLGASSRTEAVSIGIRRGMILL